MDTSVWYRALYKSRFICVKYHLDTVLTKPCVAHTFFGIGLARNRISSLLFLMHSQKQNICSQGVDRQLLSTTFFTNLNPGIYRVPGCRQSACTIYPPWTGGCSTSKCRACIKSRKHLGINSTSTATYQICIQSLKEKKNTMMMLLFLIILSGTLRAMES